MVTVHSRMRGGSGVNPRNATDFDAMVRCAQAAERGTFDFLFFPDFLGLDWILTCPTTRPC